ncbi:MAG TPA: nucleotidyl transferase AbiEii/AbiGii toxin family protein [Flavobacteriales bacterium]|nr:nucleotidyl transferase AbiEii/AbiGii toxin family protein [Flavobacteriales bacterium]HMZ47487.1 nucleotidyl transferase AbiEii/AbiGii toxin family protein [Flavobacteriales bacterium]HNK85015.1 nucleotidyl transferase AbiEii/AbiGii toxin family protein [Flavobacteriales bacterium]HNO05442.1 nucleotidyl transferase AbiEii/AbiGii toxin family protein [Flavobacteriales bacterium]
MGVPALRDFSLVGGTALALRYGHRRSMDLDLFMHGDFDRPRVVEELTKEFGNDFDFRRDQIKWAAFCTIAGVKVDIVRDPHARIADIVVDEGIRMYKDDDIAPMKIEAILHRGKKKDFWDLEVLLTKYDLPWILDKHRAKFPDNSIAISIPYAITWFVDAEQSEDPVSLKGQTWEYVKRRISERVNGFLK